MENDDWEPILPMPTLKGAGKPRAKSEKPKGEKKAQPKVEKHYGKVVAIAVLGFAVVALNFLEALAVFWAKLIIGLSDKAKYWLWRVHGDNNKGDTKGASQGS